MAKVVLGVPIARSQVTARSQAAPKRCCGAWRSPAPAVPNPMEDLFKSRRPGHSVVAVQRYLVDVVTGRPNLCVWIPRMMTTRTRAFSNSSKAARSLSQTSLLSELTGGLLMVAMPMLLAICVGGTGWAGFLP